MGFSLDVLLYHTFSLFVRSVVKLLVSSPPGDHGCSPLPPPSPLPLLHPCGGTWHVCELAPTAQLQSVLGCPLQITVSLASEKSTIAASLARGLEIGSCAFSGANTF